jgi:murein DD-endopeptidase MepM/ murein hydrolase activator NlpD
MIRIIASNIVTAVLVSAFWIVAYNMTGSRTRDEGEVAVSGDKKVVGKDGRITVAESVVVGPSGLAVPVAGVKASQLVDTFTQARAGGARVHDAIDIMAPDGTGVVSVAPGTVEKLFFSPGGGGISAYVRSDDQKWVYYYAHLRGYAPGIAEGRKVPRGALIGYVGHSGNASPSGPHLHFAINQMRGGEKWYQGSPVNPYPLLAGKAATR